MPDESQNILGVFQRPIAERLASPFIGSFCVSWAVINYKFFLIVLSANEVTKKFALVDQYVFGSIGEVVFNGIIVPTLGAFVYIFLYPLPEKFIFRFRQRKQQELNDILREIEDEKLLSFEQSQEVLLERDMCQKQLDEARQSMGIMQNEMQQLRTDLETALQEVKRFRHADIVSDHKNKLSSDAVEALRKFDLYSKPMDENDLALLLRVEVNVAKKIIEELYNGSMIACYATPEGESQKYVIFQVGQLHLALLDKPDELIRSL